FAVVGSAVVGHLRPVTAPPLGLFLRVGLACLPLGNWTTGTRITGGRITAAGVRRLLLTGALAAGLIAFWLLPYLVHRDLRGPVATWTTPPIGARVADILHGHILFPRRLGWLVVAGFVFAVVQAIRRRHYAAAAVAIPVVFLVVAHGIHHLAPTNDVSLLLAN